MNISEKTGAPGVNPGRDTEGEHANLTDRTHKPRTRDLVDEFTPSKIERTCDRTEEQQRTDPQDQHRHPATRRHDTRSSLLRTGVPQSHVPVRPGSVFCPRVPVEYPRSGLKHQHGFQSQRRCSRLRFHYWFVWLELACAAALFTPVMVCDCRAARCVSAAHVPGAPK